MMTMTWAQLASLSSWTIYHVYVIKLAAWIATALCTWVSLRSAVVFARHHERIYSVLLLFSLTWAMLTLYYSEPGQSELLQGFTGFILVHIGTLLRREKKLPPATIDYVSPYLFVIMIVPSGVSLLLALGQIPHDISSLWSPTLAIATIITLCGYFSISKAIGQNLFSLLMFFYGFAELAFMGYAYYVLYKLSQGINFCEESLQNSKFSLSTNYFTRSPCPPMRGEFLALFLILKLIFTTAFVCLTLKGKLSVEHRVLKWWKRPILLFSHLTPSDPRELDSLAQILRDDNKPESLEAENILQKLADSSSQQAEKILNEYRLSATGKT